MEIGQIIEIEITGISHQGYGVGRFDNIVVFVPQAMMGETVRAEVVEYKKKMATAQLLEVLEASPERIAVKCPQAEICGGCELQHATYAYQLQAKRQIVQDAISKLGRVSDMEVPPVKGMDDPWRYRNKGIFHADYRGGQVQLGFYQSGSHDFVPAKDCLLFSKQVNAIVATVEQLIQNTGRAHYIDKVMVRESRLNGECMVVFVAADNTWRMQEVPEKLQAAHPEVVSVYFNINNNEKLMLGRKFIHLAGKEAIVDTIGELQFQISPQSFFQVNNEQTEVLYGQALAYADLQGTETVIDAYCGIGTISMYLAKKAKEVIGVEVVAQAIQDAKQNAELNGLTNCTFIAAKTEEWLPKWVGRGNHADVIMLDPPRKGCEPAALDSIIRCQIPKIVYVSCNPSTLARDIKYLSEEGGYQLQAIQPVDLFCGSFHVETVCLLINQNAKAKHHVNVGIDAEDYYKIKEGK